MFRRWQRELSSTGVPSNMQEKSERSTAAMRIFLTTVMLMHIENKLKKSEEPSNHLANQIPLPAGSTILLDRSLPLRLYPFFHEPLFPLHFKLPYYNHENLNHIRLFVDQSLKPIYMFIKDIRRSQMSNEDHNWEFGIRDDG